MDTSTDFVDHNYTFQMDPDSIGFYGSNSLFFDNMPNNASDEIKAEFKNSHEDSPVVLPRQISIPSAPPAPEDDSKSDDNGGLDVHSIEQDAKKDFPFFEEFVIDPSETDDDKIEYKERERTSEDPIPDVDTFTNRVEKFKKMEETGTEENDDVLDVQISQKIDLTSTVSPAITIASYFDTGNYAAEAHYRNTVSSPYNQFQVGSPNVPMRIPPGFEDEYKRKLSGISSEDIIGDNKNEPHIPDTYTQTRPSNTSTYSIAHKPIVELPNTELQVLRKSPNDLQKLPPLATLVSENMYQTQIEESLPKIEDKELFASATTDVARKTQILSELKKEENIPLFGITPATTEFLKKSQVISEPKKEEITPFFGISSVTTEFPGESQIISEPRKEDITPFFGISSATTEFLGKSQIISEPKKEEITPFFGITSATTEFTGKSQIISEPRKEEITPFFGISSATTEVPGKSQIISEPRKEEITPFFGISSTTTEFPGKSQIISEPRKEEITPFFGISSATTEFPGNSQIISEPRKEEITPFLGISSATTEFSGKSQIISEPKIEENTPFFGISPASTELAGTSHIFSGKPLQANEQNPLTQTLPDPISFFSAAEKSSNKQEESDNNFNRLASYFTTPTKTDPAKSFFELSQSQNHYRHASSEDNRHFKVRKTMDNDNTESRREGDSNMESEKLGAVRKDVTVNFNDVSEESSDGVAVLTEQRAVAEYTPVKHHWFYRVDLDNKSMWRGFSIADSRALEESFHSVIKANNVTIANPEVNVPYNLEPVTTPDFINPCHASATNFKKGSSGSECNDALSGTSNIVVLSAINSREEDLNSEMSYSDSSSVNCELSLNCDSHQSPANLNDIDDALSEEYRHGITTGEWHRRLILPNNESVVMHGPGVMVHLLQSTTDGFSSTPSTIRPRVVRRGWDETEIEDTEPSSIDHLLLLCHGVGSVCDMRLRSVEKVVDDFRATSLQLLQSHYRNSYDNGIVNRIEVLPISWHSTLHSSETGVDRRLAQITLDSIPKLRNFTNDTVLDVLFYTSPVFCQTILDTVCTEINRVYNLFSSRNPGFKGSVSLGGHSLGSVILYDLLCHQTPDTWESPDKRYVSGPAGTGQASVRYPRLDFSPATLYALGSPIAMFECIRGVESLGGEFALPTCKNFFNIFHPYDPIAYRIEPLINPQLRDVKPFLIPHHKGRKRMHLELKDTMARVGADLKQKLIESLKSTWSNMWRTQSPPTDGQLEKVVEEEMEKEQLCEEIKEDVLQDDVIIPGSLGKLNCGRRVDYVLQEAPFEMINEYLFAMSSHVCYWESEDTMLLILREIYSSLGVQPDCTVPQQSMTVQRTRPAREEETIVMNAADVNVISWFIYNS
ncbi:phosphatidic Acid Phospholipase A1 [Aphomia sociella]